VLNIKDADILFDYSAVDHATRLKSITLKTDNSLNTGNLKINGGAPDEYIASQTLDEVKLLEEINNIELGGENISIDDVSLNDFSKNETGWDFSTFSFDSSFNKFIDSTETDYTLIYSLGIRILNQQSLPYSSNIDSVYFRAKFADKGFGYSYSNGEMGFVTWADDYSLYNECESRAKLIQLKE